ncbi:S8 family serine peptidase [Peribacillus muralis]|uniref:S8 family serine peptidase n=1 Tax=Peribacillus muralis TaxID=264697 RepID=UPI00070E083B|nr:S8 family serine peptidase [Peribacillus muralis]
MAKAMEAGLIKIKSEWMMKQLKSKILKRMKNPFLTILSVGVLSITFQSNLQTVSAVKNTSGEKILASLTQEQKEALNELKVYQSNGLEGFSKKELENDKEISVIVEFRSKPEKVAILNEALMGKKISENQAKTQVDQEHEQFKRDIKQIFPATSAKKAKQDTYKITRNFKTTYNGVSMNIPANEVEKLLKSKAVKAVHKSEQFTIDPPAETDTKNVQGTEVTLDSGAFLNVDKLHKEGYTGKGVKVAVIDTGLDYNHPDLKAVFKGGRDFVDNDEDPMETTYEDWKKSGRPLYDGGGNSYYTDHGTHVSGTIAAQAQNSTAPKVKGIAPDADLYAYRVLGPYGSGDEEDIMAGIDQAVIDGMDVMNLSLGGNSNDPAAPLSTAINYAVLNGVTAVVTAGNNGPSDYTIGNPGAAAFGLTVGASSSPLSVVKYAGRLTGLKKGYNLSNLYKAFNSDLKALEGKSLDIVDMNDGMAADYVNKDVKGKVVFIKQGIIGTQDKVLIAKNNGASVVITYNNRPNEGPSNFVREDQRFVPTFSLSNDEGLDFKAQLTTNKKLTFENYKETFTDGDKLASFSSRGPTRKNYDMKPEVTAPGVSVLSTVPAYSLNPDKEDDYQYAYDRLSGTSMAAPHVAGIAALLLQANPELGPQDIKTILMNTAKPLNGTYSVFDVGAGRVDPYRAVHNVAKIAVQDQTGVVFDREDVSLKEQTGGLAFGSHYAREEINLERTVKIENEENKKKTFMITTYFQRGVSGSLDAKQNGVKLTAPPIISVTASKSKNIPVSIRIPATARPGVYEGYIMVTNQENSKERYRVPFSIRTTEEGFNATDLSEIAISPPYLHVKRIYQSNSSASLLFNFKAPMKRLDLILEDGKTGKELGFLGTVNVESLYDGINYSIQDAFNGTYYAYTDDTHQAVASQVSYAKPGQYSIKVIGTTERDKVFSTYEEIYIDHIGPKMTTSFDTNETRVIEYQEGQNTVPLHVQVTDKEVEQMTAAGIEVDQSINAFNYSLDGNYSTAVQVGSDGILDFDVPMNEAVPFLKLNVFGTDAANNPSVKENYYFVKEGTPYSFMKADKTVMKMGDSTSAKLALHNVINVKSAEWTINTGSNLEISDVKLDESLASHANAKVSVEKTGNTAKVKLDLNGSKGVSGDINAVRMQIKVNDSSFAANATWKMTASYTDETDNQHTISGASSELTIQPAFSEVYGSLRSEGLGFGTDWTKVGATVQVIDSDGKKYDGTSTLDRIGSYRITKLPLSDKPFTWKMTLPGHFSISQQLPIGVTRDNEVWGQLLQYFSKNIVAGDVNQDQVIDILDAMAVQKAWNTSDRAADINFDGIVNAKDMSYIQNNYQKQNADANNPPSPLDEKDGKTLNDILNELGITQ